MFFKKKILFLVLLLLSYISISAQESVSNAFNPFDIESINHWNLKVSSINWESATIKNALEIPYVTFLSDYVKGKYNLFLNDSPKKIKATGYQFSSPKCYKDKCSDFYISFITSGSNYFPAYKKNIETSITNFKNGTEQIKTTIVNNSEGYLSSSKQDLKNLLINYQNDYYFFQNNPYLKNLGFRFGIGLDIYQYKATISGIEYLYSVYVEEHEINTSQNTTIINTANIFVTNHLDYLEAALKLKIGLNYIYEFLDRNLIFTGIDLHYGYGAVSYKLKEERINTDFINILNSGKINPLAISAALPQSRLTDGPAFLEIPGYEYYLSYGYKIDPHQIIRLVYRYKQEYHTLKAPKIEPDENINLAAVSQGDITPFILSEIDPQGLIPSNSEFIREIGIEYMYKF
ncbi:MAG: hypothetical protein KatS3mg129_1223 [Leptospiraceae bacterium]|nr:MAG: hypothetical protein KatS3mg129_1223 [Leptospiraceae bacterium]